jgi:diketogulonate reductase-like aldo/keto reductase
MAYSPLEQSRLPGNPQLAAFAQRHGMTPAQAALAWLLANDDDIDIPKCSHRERLRENIGALDHGLTKTQRAELDRLFPPPAGPGALDML